WVLLGAVLMGMPLGLGNPVTNQLIVTRIDSAAQGTATGIKQSGVQVGALFVGLTLPPIAGAYGWRLAMGSVVVVALIGLMLSFPLRRSGACEAGRYPPAGSARISPLALCLAGYAVLMGYGVSAVNAFL